jgi:hypothetical protein
VGTFVVLVMVAVGEAQSPATQALALAVRAGLGGSQVLIREGDEPDGSRLAELAHAQGAALAASVRWSEEPRPRAAVRAYVTASGAVVERELVFDPADDPRERGRTVGLVLASLVPEPPPPVAIAAAPAPPAPPEAARWHLEAAAAGVMGVTGDGGGVGGALGLRLRLSPRWSARAGARGWLGEVGSAQASSRALAGGLGLGVLLTPPAARLGLEVHLDLLALGESLAHFSEDDPAPVRLGRVQPGATLMTELVIPLAGGAAVTLGIGALGVPGVTDVFVDAVRVTTLPRLRLLAQGGLRVGL